MKLERVIEILEKHQEWRRDQNVPPKTEMQSPIEIGTAIDYALTELKKLRLGDVSSQRELLLAFLQSISVSHPKTNKFVVDNFLSEMGSK